MAIKLVDEDFERGGLWLNVKGLDKTDIISSPICMPDGCKEKTAISLNHAFTMLSEMYETHRLSHTGNVYNRVSITWTTHEVDGLSANDLTLARLCDEVFASFVIAFN